MTPDPIFAAFNEWVAAYREYAAACAEHEGEDTARMTAALTAESAAALRLARTRPTSPAGFAVFARAVAFAVAEPTDKAIRDPAAAQAGDFRCDHWADGRGGVALATLLGVGTELGFGSEESDLLRAIRQSTQQNVSQAGQRLTEKNLNIQPTITVRPGWPIRVIVQKDLILRPYRG